MTPTTDGHSKKRVYDHELPDYSSSIPLISTVSTDILTTSSEPSSFRIQSGELLERSARRPSGVLKPKPAQAMSLVGLKHLFFKRTFTPGLSRLDSRDSRGVLGHRDCDRTATRTQDTNDVESQGANTKSDKATERKAFRVDARIISDATIGLSDGLTVPFALTAGLSALGNTKVVIYGGLAELIAGAISMGLGGYLGAKSEAASYKATRAEAALLIATNPQAIVTDLAEIFEPYDLPKSSLEDLTGHLTKSPRLVDFVMQFKHCAEPPAASRAFTSAMTIALGYFLGGLLPLIPYFFVDRNQVYTGLYISIGVMVVALFVFGYVKTCVVIGWQGEQNVRRGCLGGLQMVVIGSFAAGAAMGLVRAANHNMDAGVAMTRYLLTNAHSDVTIGRY